MVSCRGVLPFLKSTLQWEMSSWGASETVWVGLYKLVNLPKICVIKIISLDSKVTFNRLSKEFCSVCVGFGGFVV